MNAWIKESLGYIQLLTVVVGFTIFIAMTKANGDNTATSVREIKSTVETIREEQSLIRQRLALIEYQIQELNKSN